MYDRSLVIAPYRCIDKKNYTLSQRKEVDFGHYAPLGAMSCPVVAA
jgi:hypothetical protein